MLVCMIILNTSVAYTVSTWPAIVVEVFAVIGQGTFAGHFVVGKTLYLPQPASYFICLVLVTNDMF